MPNVNYTEIVGVLHVDVEDGLEAARAGVVRGWCALVAAQDVCQGNGSDTEQFVVA